MRAITLTQPWATLVAIGAKKIETRSWWTSYRGPIAIHAAKNYPPNVRPLCLEEPFLSALKAAGLHQFGVWHPSNNELPLGCVVAIADLVQCVQVDRHPYEVDVPAYVQGALVINGVRTMIPPPEPERSFGEYAPGRYAWLLNNVRPLPEPIPATGALGLWDWRTPEGIALP